MKKWIEGVRESINIIIQEEETGDKLRGNRLSWTEMLGEPFGLTGHRQTWCLVKLKERASV